MPINLLKKYPELLELTGNLRGMLESLRGIYNRDIENNPDFKFRGIIIHPLKSEGQDDMDRTFRRPKSMLNTMRPANCYQKLEESLI